jgi:tryptophan synthase beta chain
LQTPDGQISTTHSVSAGLDYPAVGPEHAWLAELGRAEYTAIGDEDAINAASTLARKEGIIPALESAHALGELLRRAPQMKKDEIVMFNLSGRGDKDMDFLSRHV